MSGYVNDGLDGVDDFDIADESLPVEDNNNNNKVPNAKGDGLKPGLLNYYSQYFSSTQFVERCQMTLKNQDLGAAVEDLYGFVWIIMTCSLMKLITKTFYELIDRQLIHGGKVNEDGHVNIDLMFHTLWIFILFDILGSVIVSYRMNDNNKMVSILSIFGYSNVNWLFVFPLVDLIQYMLADGMVSLGIKWALTSLVVVKITHFLTVQKDIGGDNFMGRVIILVIQTLKMIAINLFL